MRNIAMCLDHPKRVVRRFNRVGSVHPCIAIDASQRLDRFALIDVQMPAMFGHDVAAVMRQGRSMLLPIALLPSQLAARAREAGNVVDEIRDGLTDAERQSQKGA